MVYSTNLEEVWLHPKISRDITCSGSISSIAKCHAQRQLAGSSRMPAVRVEEEGATEAQPRKDRIVWFSVRYMWSYDYGNLKSCSDLDLNRDDPAWWNYLESQDEWHKSSLPPDIFSRFIWPDFLTQIYMIMYDLAEDMFDSKSVAASSTGMMTPTTVSKLPYQRWSKD